MFSNTFDGIINYLPRVRQPNNMLNGRYDFIHSSEYRDCDKRIVIYDARHWGFPIIQFVKEVADSLDKHLGPVRP